MKITINKTVTQQVEMEIEFPYYYRMVDGYSDSGRAITTFGKIDKWPNPDRWQVGNYQHSVILEVTTWQDSESFEVYIHDMYTLANMGYEFDKRFQSDERAFNSVLERLKNYVGKI